MKVKAGTILETLIALVVVMDVFGISILIFENVTGGKSSVRQLAVNLILDDAMIETIKTGSFIDEDITVGDFVIKKTVEKYDNNDRLLIITLACSDKKGKELGSKKQLYFNR